MKTYIVKDKMLPNADTEIVLCRSAKDHRAYAEIKEDARICGPGVFRMEARKGHFTINNTWTLRYITDRIVPPERQNISDILKEMGKKAYDPFEMLVWCGGKSCMDDTYIEQIREAALPAWYQERILHRIMYTFVLTKFRLLLVFRNGRCGLFDLAKKKPDDRHFAPFRTDLSRFRQVILQPDGMSVRWNDYTEIMYDELYESCIVLPLSGEDITAVFADGLLTSQEFAESLGISRQYLQKENAKRHFAVKETEKSTLYVKHTAV